MISGTTSLALLYADEVMVAVDKPSGQLVHRGWGQDAVTTVDLLAEQLGRRVLPVHRLDRGTSGVLLLALDPLAARQLHEQLESGRAEKTYLALVRGDPPEAGVIDHPIPRREGGPRVDAVTEYRTLLRFGRFAWVEARPRTGRLHQVRRHLKHLGHPIIGDVNYGRGELNRMFRSEHQLHRLALHAARLRLTRPGGGELLTLEAPLPQELSRVLERLGVGSAAAPG